MYIDTLKSEADTQHANRETPNDTKTDTSQNTLHKIIQWIQSTRPYVIQYILVHMSKHTKKISVCKYIMNDGGSSSLPLLAITAWLNMVSLAAETNQDSFKDYANW